MAVRRWQVHPDVGFPTEDGVLGVVSREALDQALLDGASLLDRAGGVFTVIVGRGPTDLPGEMLTTGVVCEWKDRTDAKPQPEQRVDVVAPPPDLEAAQEIQDEVDAQHQREVDEAVAAVESLSPDGLDESQLEDEDVSEIPESAR